ncbi:interleukin-12 subunit beta [Odontesthes bonariensis]|uniref:interleukin-12 subunit beta n=1 Tax=Odontesthes bonariensis TaxID=219752 RepID=UPI003F58BB8F
MTMLVWISALLVMSLTGAHGLNHFPENFVVADRYDTKPVTLACNAETDGPVIWKFNGEEVDDEDSIQMVGSNLMISDVDTPMLGEYSCWRGGKNLSSTYLLLNAGEEEDLDYFLTCRAKSYDCSFSCSWTDKSYTVRLGIGQDCSEGKRSCNWEKGSDQLHKGGIQFLLTHSLLPYAEESTKIELTAEAIKDLSILRKSKAFYLRDIIQPDSPTIVRCEEVEQDLNVTIEPPSSWSTPHSFFSLEHQIEYKYRDDGKTGRSLSTLIPRGISQLRVRSRDPLVPSPWSQWTAWKNVKNKKKNLCGRKKKPKIHRSELSSKSTNARRKGEKKRPKDATRSITH